MFLCWCFISPSFPFRVPTSSSTIRARSSWVGGSLHCLLCTVPAWLAWLIHRKKRRSHNGISSVVFTEKPNHELDLWISTWFAESTNMSEIVLLVFEAFRSNSEINNLVSLILVTEIYEHVFNLWLFLAFIDVFSPLLCSWFWDLSSDHGHARSQDVLHRDAVLVRSKLRRRSAFIPFHYKTDHLDRPPLY